MMQWLSGPQAIAELEAWCAINGTTLSKLAGSCAPVVYRSTLGRWRAGVQPERRVWNRLCAAMAAHEEAGLARLLG